MRCQLLVQFDVQDDVEAKKIAGTIGNDPRISLVAMNRVILDPNDPMYALAGNKYVDPTIIPLS